MSITKLAVSLELFIIVTLVSTTIYVEGKCQKRAASTSPIVLFGGITLLFYVGRPLIIWISGWRFFGKEVVNDSTNGEWLLLLSLALVIVGICAFYTGYYSKVGKVASRVLPAFKIRVNPIVLTIPITLFTLILFSFALYVNFKWGGFPLTDGYPRSRIVSSFIGKVLTTFHFAAHSFFVFGAYIIYLLRRQIKGKSLPYVIHITILMAIIATIQLLIGSRTRFFLLFLSTFILYILLGYKISIIRFMSYGFVIYIMAYVGFPIMMYSLGLNSNPYESANIVEVFQSVRNGDKIDNTMVIIGTVDTSELLLGGSLLGFVENIVPSVSGHSSPFIHETQHFVKTYFPYFYGQGIGFPLPLFANAYWNFHIVGVILAGLLLGAVYRIAYLYALSGNGLSIVFYSSIYFSLYSTYVSSLSNAISRFGITVLYLLVAFCFASMGKVHK